MSTPSGLPDDDGSAYQLAEWVTGRPHHNPIRGECCPDFSCCCPSLLASPEVRAEFAAATGDARDKMLMMFLGGALAAAGKRDATYIAGLDSGGEA